MNNDNCSVASLVRPEKFKIRQIESQIVSFDRCNIATHTFNRVDRSAPTFARDISTLNISALINDAKMYFTVVDTVADKNDAANDAENRAFAAARGCDRCHDTLQRDACRMEQLLHSGSLTTINGRRCTARRLAGSPAGTARIASTFSIWSD